MFLPARNTGRYRQQSKAKAELHEHEKAEAEAVFPKEKAMYEKLAADASTRCLMAYQWQRDFCIALQKVEPFKARMVLEQHFIRGQPLKAIEVGHGKTMSRTTPTTKRSESGASPGNWTRSFRSLRARKKLFLESEHFPNTVVR